MRKAGDELPSSHEPGFARDYRPRHGPLDPAGGGLSWGWVIVIIATLAAALLIAGALVGSDDAGAAPSASPMTVREAKETLYETTRTTREALELGLLDWVAPGSELEREITVAPDALERLELRIDRLKEKIDRLEARIDRLNERLENR